MRRTLLVAVVAGVILATGVLVAVAFGTLNFSRVAESNEYPVSQLEYAVVSDCSLGSFVPADGNSLGLLPTLDIDLTHVSNPAMVLCLRTDPSAPAAIPTVTVDLVTLSDGELSCGEHEALVDPEGSKCGNDGELDDLYEIRVKRLQGPSSCVSVTLDRSNTSGTLATDLVECAWQFDMHQKDGATTDEIQAASFDLWEWQINVSS